MGLCHYLPRPSVTCAGRGHEACNCMTYRAPGLLFWYSGLYPPLTVTDTRSLHSFTQTLLEIGYCYRRQRPGISATHNSIAFAFSQHGTNTRKLFNLINNISYIILLTNKSSSL